MALAANARALARGVGNAVMLLSRGDWRGFIVRLRVTLGEIDLQHDPTEAISDRTHYYADSGGLAFDRIMAHFSITPKDAIVDFGCGKGGVLISLSKYPFAKISGVEISPELVAIAEKNLQALGIRNVQIHCCDAADFAQLADYTYFYFFDPFPCVVMQEVLQNIERSLKETPRRITLIYLNPFCHQLIETSGRFVKVQELPHFAHPCFVYRNVD